MQERPQVDDSARDIDASCRRGAMWRDENGAAEEIAVVGADAHQKVWEGSPLISLLHLRNVRLPARAGHLSAGRRAAPPAALLQRDEHRRIHQSARTVAAHIFDAVGHGDHRNNAMPDKLEEDELDTARNAGRAARGRQH